MELLRSGDNLLKSVKEFVANSENVKIFSPFIKVNVVKDILGSSVCDTIVVRWRASDILAGMCDFEALYEFCLENKITLFRNTQIHLKVILNNKNHLLYGSANITNRGMGESYFNWELSGITNHICLSDLIYLQKILNESRLVTPEYFSQLKEQIDELRKNHKPSPEIPEIKIEKSDSEKFLMSSLPMSESPEILWEIYNDDIGIQRDVIKMLCASHDISNYNIPSGLKQSDFYLELAKSFNQHPFIEALKEAIQSTTYKNMGFTQLNQWLIDNTTTVPTPRRWDLRDNNMNQILHRWICGLDNRFISDIRYPSGSDRLVFEGN